MRKFRYYQAKSGIINCCLMEKNPSYLPYKDETRPLFTGFFRALDHFWTTYFQNGSSMSLYSL
jgi:hypothetical protein